MTRGSTMHGVVRGLGKPRFVRQPPEQPMVVTPMRCQCGASLRFVGYAPSTEGIAHKVVMRCSRRACAAPWVVTTTIRALKEHEVLDLLSAPTTAHEGPPDAREEGRTDEGRSEEGRADGPLEDDGEDDDEGWDHDDDPSG